MGAPWIVMVTDKDQQIILLMNSILTIGYKFCIGLNRLLNANVNLLSVLSHIRYDFKGDNSRNE